MTVKWLSAMLLALCVGVWIASAWWTLNWASPGGLYVGIDSGRIWVSVYGSLSQAQTPTHIFCYHHPARFFLWFDAEQRGAWKYVWIPVWVLIGPALIGMIAAWKWDGRARRLAMAGHCSKCGYDLSAPGTICPECGAARGMT